MRLQGFLAFLRTRWRTFVLIWLLCIALSVAAIFLTPKEYESSTQIFVATSAQSSAQDLASGNSFVQARVQTYVDAAATPSVTEPVIRRLGLQISATQLSSRITADAPLNKVLINIHVTDSNAAESARLVNAVSAQFISVIEGLETIPGGNGSAVSLSIIRPGVIPSVPTSPNITLLLGLGIALGAALGLAGAAVRQALDTSFKASTQLENATGLAVLSSVPLEKAPNSSLSVFRADPHGRQAEALRKARTSLQFVNVDSPPRVISVVSALPGEGKSHTSINLAAALAEGGARVCLIETDLRRPSIANSLGLVAETGLTSVLIDQTSVEDVLQNAGTNLAVMTCGATPPNPAELLASRKFQDVISSIADQVDYVVLDTAPLLSVADGAQVAAHSDAVILCVRASRTSRDDVTRALAVLSSVDAPVVGAVLTMAPLENQRDYYYYYSNKGDQGGKPDLVASAD